MTPRALAIVPVVILALLALHNDFWLWHDGGRLLGLPVGLTYHLLYCLAATVAMALLVRLGTRR